MAPVVEITSNTGAAPAAPPTTAVTLYDLEQNLQALFDTTEMVGPEQEDAFLRELHGALIGAADKRDRVAQFLAYLEHQAQFAEQEIKRLRERKAAIERAQQRLEHYVLWVISVMAPDEKTGKPRKLVGNTCTLQARTCPPSVEIYDEAAIPEEYTVIKAESVPDKKAIKAALEADIDVPGATLIKDKLSLRRS